MKTINCLMVLIAFVGLSLVGCTDKSLSPVGPADQNTTVSLDKKGPVVHRIQGSGNFTWGGKNAGARYAAHEYYDGTIDGVYQVNVANATGIPVNKWNSNVISFKIHENVGQYGGKMVVFLGQEKTEMYAGWYEVVFAIDNGKPGQTTAPDQVCNYAAMAQSLDVDTGYLGLTLEDWFNLSPEELISYLETTDCDKGNIIIE